MTFKLKPRSQPGGESRGPGVTSRGNSMQGRLRNGELLAQVSIIGMRQSWACVSSPICSPGVLPRHGLGIQLILLN